MNRVVDASGDPPPRHAVDRAVGALGAGGVVVVPTDTVYGLAVAATQPGATEGLFALKQRPVHVALPVLVANLDQALALAADESLVVARRLMERFWPGAVTLVVPRRPGLGLDLGGPDDLTVGLRLPDHPVPVALAAAAGPLAVTSANRHGRPTPTALADVLAQLGAGVEVALDAGPLEGRASTVVSCAADGVRVLREGAVPAAEVLAAARL
ncbi:MAG: L-threonylcarbamoyladenylate synthase [Acidimicrobiales bacterium]